MTEAAKSGPAPAAAPILGWYKELGGKERRTLWACIGGWGLDALDVQMYSFVIPGPDRDLEHHPRPGGRGGDRRPAAVRRRRLDRGLAVRQDRPRQDAADLHRLVRGLHLPLRLGAELRAALRRARPHGAGLRRRMGGGRGASGRDHPPAAPGQGARLHAGVLGRGLGGGGDPGRDHVLGPARKAGLAGAVLRRRHPGSADLVRPSFRR